MKPLTLASLLLLFYFSATAQTAYWQQSLQYQIAVSLNDNDNTLDGTLKLNYTNNSPDTLRFIWFHTWPNAYKNDRTDFSEQLLENGRTDFYFSDKADRGYMNRLDFRVNQEIASTEDHPRYFDVIKLNLPSPLAPGDNILITTPFHVQLPKTFSRSGYDGKSYQVTQWYPKPAVYDKKGWHEMPYLDQGEFYSEYGDFEVQITLPENYVVAATGKLQNEVELEWLNQKNNLPLPTADKSKKKSTPKKIPATQKSPTKQSQPKTNQQPPTKTLIFKQTNVHDFAWFANTNFIVRLDSLTLASGKTIQTSVYFLPKNATIWANSQEYLKKAIQFHSSHTGEYPYQQVTVVEGKQGFAGGMEYPTITILNGATDEVSLEKLIVHEVGHNWFYGLLGSNERKNPWMDEGLNTYYDNRYSQESSNGKSMHSRFPSEERMQQLIYETIASVHRDQPITTSADSMYKLNYQAITYYKTADWFKKLEQEISRPLFDSSIQTYFQRWQFKHPEAEDLQQVFTDVSGKNLDEIFGLLGQTGPLYTPVKKKLRFAPFISFKETEKYNYIFTSPLLGYNTYDGLMAGLLFHNYTLPLNKFQFAIAPLYGFKSKSLNGIGHLGYNFYPKGIFQQVSLTADAAKFSGDDFISDDGQKFVLGFRKLAPAIRLEWKEKNPRSTRLRYFQYKAFFISEDGLNFSNDTVNNTTLINITKSSYTVNQFKYVWEQYRTLYPYRFEMQFETGPDFGRLAFTGNYFFNFRKKGGVAVRLFAGKFFYLGGKTSDKQFDTDRFHLNMSGPKGYEDYTYSNYFLGRNEFEGFPSQQIMTRDGFFKVRTDLYSDKVGKTDNWLAATNIVLDVPDRFNILNVLPVKIPLKIFADLGTYSGAWEEDDGQTRLLFDAGLQFSFFKSAVNIYMPLIYSKVYRDYYESTPGNNFFQRMSFSIDLTQISFRKWIHESF
jgi:Peptidase family M1 domain